jgi:ribosomal protein S18 acetylase RimI-like enzyme
MLVEVNMPADDPKASVDIILKDSLDPAELAVLVDGLEAHNLSRVGYNDFRPIAVTVRDPQTNKVVGGLSGRSHYGMVYVDWLFLPEGLRGARIGCRLLAMAEDEARRRGCTRITLSTMSVEAPGFYRKQGYDVAATIDCEPSGITRYYMMKKL